MGLFDAISDFGDWQVDRWKDQTSSLKKFAKDPFMGAGGGKDDRKARDRAQKAKDEVEAIRIEEQERNTALNKPWVDQGLVAGQQLANENFDPGEQAPVADYVDPTFQHDFQADPGYQFRLKESQDAIANRAAAMGGARNPGTLAALAGRAGQMASEEYGNSYNRARDSFEGDRQFGYGKYTDKITQGNNLYGQKRQRLADRFDQLSSIAGRGVNAGNQQQSVYNTSAASRSDNVMGLANANQAIQQNRTNTNMQLLNSGLSLGSSAAKAYMGGG